MKKPIDKKRVQEYLRFLQGIPAADISAAVENYFDLCTRRGCETVAQYAKEIRNFYYYCY